MQRATPRIARKRKEIKRVKAAIRWAENAQRKGAEGLQQRRDNKAYIVNRLQWTSQYPRENAQKARERYVEDWKLGPLRPNRAFGPGKARYGVMKSGEFSEPRLPEHLQKKAAASPIQRGDRVVLVRGREKGKIAVIEDLHMESNTVSFARGINEAYIDSRGINASAGGKGEKKRQWAMPVLMDDVRLIVRDRSTNRDVIVDGIEMREHTRGINFFTGKEQAFIPPEQRVWPETGDKIYHRFIAGTESRIDWPWEIAKREEEAEKREKAAKATKKEDNQQGGVLHRARSLLGKLKRQPSEKTKDTLEPEQEEINLLKTPIPIERQPLVQFPDDTPGNDRIEVTYEPGLLSPPFPESVIDELRNKYNGKPLNEVLWDDKYEDVRRETSVGRVSEERTEKSGLEQATNIPPTMMTPMQVKRELALAGRKRLSTKEIPEISADVLKIIGATMVKNGITWPKRTAAPAAEQTSSLEEEKQDDRVLFPAPKPEPKRSSRNSRGRLRKEKKWAIEDLD
ncbi:hypothetical protein EJ04DRAFT_510467 [Polyplosphaeria fusca]|uniref:KOW domain-containing protein n=1 Tax=Polyplosphaeria fusca TaxID=682080 RepID=A0A9P4R639_9PLEO|nr:hypothetical protein EJ04DRAFT_510467 [Polyplosphaeria fusca]